MSVDARDGDRLRTPSLRRRAMLTVLSLLAVMLVVLVVVTSTVLAGRLDAQLRDRLGDRATFAAGLAGEVEPQELVRRLEGDDVSVLLVTDDGERLTAGPVPAEPTGAPPSDGPGPRRPPGGPGPAERGTSEVVRSGDLLRVERDLPGVGTLVLSADAGTVRATVAQVRLTLAIAAVVVLALASAILWPVLGRTLRPLDRITGLARSISAGDRGRRLRPDRGGTELGRTASAFDAMLDDVERSEARALASERRLRAFLSDAAHELRTPVAGVRAAAEHVLRSDPPRAEREQVLAGAVRESERIGRLVDDLLLIARIDGGLEVRPVPTDLADVARQVASTRELIDPTTRVEVEGVPVVVPADGARIAQVLSNLVDNAARAARGGTVRLRVGHAGGCGSVEVVDDGPGVPEEERERVFERLVRLDGARSGEGFGLGLPIARGIARAHGGDLTCRAVDPGGGARFVLTLPA